MTIIYTYQRSKKRKPNAKQRQLAQEWQELVKRSAPQKITKVKVVTNKIPSLSVPPGRETPKFPSLNSSAYTCTKKQPLYYTGDKMKGIGTLHKSNAVPIFTDEEAKDQANMRR
jgi:uncharacterized protein YnzC (UPF0291/DUF896 family)